MATLSTLELLAIYKTNILKFLDSLVELFPEESDLIVMRILFGDGTVPIEDSMRKFSSRIIPAAEMIHQRNDKFFLSDGMIFSGIGSDKVIRWKQLWQSKRLDAVDRDAVWSWMTLFLGLAEMYIKNTSRPTGSL